MCYNIPKSIKRTNKKMTLTPIAVIKNDYKEKFAVPRQSCLANSVMSKIIFEKEYASPLAFKGLEGFSHIWII